MSSNTENTMNMDIPTHMAAFIETHGGLNLGEFYKWFEGSSPEEIIRNYNSMLLAKYNKEVRTKLEDAQVKLELEICDRDNKIFSLKSELEKQKTELDIENLVEEQYLNSVQFTVDGSWTQTAQMRNFYPRGGVMGQVPQLFMATVRRLWQRVLEHKNDNTLRVTGGVNLWSRLKDFARQDSSVKNMVERFLNGLSYRDGYIYFDKGNSGETSEKIDPEDRHRSFVDAYAHKIWCSWWTGLKQGWEQTSLKILSKTEDMKTAHELKMLEQQSEAKKFQLAKTMEAELKELEQQSEAKKKQAMKMMEAEITADVVADIRKGVLKTEIDKATKEMVSREVARKTALLLRSFSAEKDELVKENEKLRNELEVHVYGPARVYKAHQEALKNRRSVDKERRKNLADIATEM